MRNVFIAIITFIGMVLGFYLNIWAASVITNNPLSFSEKLKISTFIMGFYYVIMLIAFFTVPLFFNTLYYILYLTMGLFINILLTTPLYLIIHYIFNLSIITELLIYFVPGFTIIIIGIYKEKTIIIDRIYLHYKNFKGKFTIAQLSDIHLGANYQADFIQKIVDILKKESPNIVVITGDIVDGNIAMTLDMIEPFNQLSMPIYYITGNHEEFAGVDYVLSLINQTKIKHLKDTSILINNKINLIGIDYYDKTNKSHAFDVINNNSQYDKNIPNIVLYHVPFFKMKELVDYGIFLCLAGHTHGGQFFPCQLGQMFLYTKLSGLISDENNYMYVSSGVGTSGPPIRTFSKSVITMIEIS